MKNFIMRFRMYFLLEKMNKADLENKPMLSVCNLDKDEEVLEALEDAGCIQISVADCKISHIYRGKRSRLYLIERSELWVNRAFSYILGIISGILITAIANGILH